MMIETERAMTGVRLMRAAVMFGVYAVLVTAAESSAQSLGDLARQGEAQRKTASAGRTYTNDSLGTTDSPTPPAVAAPEPAATPDTQAPAVESKPEFKVEEDQATGHTNMKTARAREKRDEQYWRNMIAGIRATIARLNGDIAAQQSKLDQIQGNTPTTAREREVVSATIARMQNDLALQNNELSRWTARARAANVPEDAIK